MVSTRSKMKSGNPKSGNPKAKKGETSGINKPNTNVRKSNARSKKELHDRKVKRNSDKDQLQKKLETINQALQKTETDLKVEGITDETRTKLEGHLKQILSDKQQTERQLNEFKADLQKIEEDLMDIDQDGESTSLDAQTSLDASSSKAADGFQDASPNGQMSTTTSPFKEAADPQDSSNSAFLSQEKVVDEEDPSSSIETDGEPLYETASEPSDYGDFDVIDLTKDENDNDLLEGGKTLVTAKRRGGNLYLNSYGPKNSAMLTWSSSPAAKEGRSVANILADPHIKALERDNHGNLKYKGKIACIKAIAWKPKRVIRSMQDVLDSVEELDPLKKQGKKYRFPFSSVLVDWKEDHNMPPPVWVNRTTYKILTSTSKEESGRTDRKFHTIALIQAKRYKEWAGYKRIGADNQSPTPLEETPDPENHLNSQNVRRDSNDQTPSDQTPSDQTPGDQTPGDQNPNHQTPSDQNSNHQSTSSQNNNYEITAPNGQSQNGGTPASNTLRDDRNQVPNTFSMKEYIQGMKEDLELDNVRQENEQEYIRQLANVRAEWDSYRKVMEAKGFKQVK